MSFQWTVVDGVLGTAQLDDGVLAEFRPATLSLPSVSRANSVDLLGMEIDDSLIGRLLLHHLEGTDIRQLSVYAIAAASHQLPPEDSVRTYHPQHEVELAEHETLTLFGGLRWDRFLIDLLNERFLRRLCSPTYHGRCAIKEPLISAFPNTINLIFSTSRRYIHAGETFCGEATVKVVGVHQDSIEAIEAVLIASNRYPDFSQEFAKYLSTARHLRHLRRKIAERLRPVLQLIQSAPADEDRYREILLWLETNEAIPSFLTTALSEIRGLSESDDVARMEFQTLYSDLIDVVRRTTTACHQNIQ